MQESKKEKDRDKAPDTAQSGEKTPRRKDEMSPTELLDLVRKQQQEQQQQ